MMARQINETSETYLIMEIFVEKVYEMLVLQQKCFLVDKFPKRGSQANAYKNFAGGVPK